MLALSHNYAKSIMETPILSKSLTTVTCSLRSLAENAVGEAEGIAAISSHVKPFSERLLRNASSAPAFASDSEQEIETHEGMLNASIK